MIGIFLSKVKLLIRRPWTFIVMTAAAVGFAYAFSYVIGTAGNMNGLHVPIVADDAAIEQSIVGEILTDSEAHNFHWVSEDDLNWHVDNGKVEVGVILRADDFDMIVGVNSQNIGLIEQTVRNAYVKKKQYNHLEEEANGLFSNEEKDIKINEIKEGSAFTVEKQNFKIDGEKIDHTYQPLFGFTLFFIIYTIAYNVLYILVEKQGGVWDRMILSPVRKWEMYVANFVYSFLSGYIQVIIIFLVFRYVVQVDFNGSFLLTLVLVIPYVFAIVALSMLITGIAKTVQQFNAVIPIIAVSMAMIGGAYWPLEVVQSEIILSLSKIIPITYGMELLNGVAVYGYPLSDLLFPLSVLLLMGVIFTGIGIHLMEKRHL